ncbi:serine/threonine protein phosphatase 2A 57 kDa regulatory subunit B' beta isoform-like [Aristolochia californica]|uniref:serine/threonine protein phosphatase 2A 57 kDa regulatory subunit B' beta isoform-like n=1 Tax=Aristolochia californica TaxID=171875 RepID=UPI0035E1BB9D
MGAQRKAPKASAKKKSTTLQYLFDLDAIANGDCESPSHDSEMEELLSMISICSFVFTFTDPEESPAQQALKRHKLNQVLSVIRSSRKPLEDQILSPLFSMLADNLFRPLPPPFSASIPSGLLDEEELYSLYSPAWPHLVLVYDILNRLVLSIEPQILRTHIDQPFLLNLLNLFNSEDRQERDALKNIYHRIYSKCAFYRSFMRKSMSDVFLRFVYDTQRHCGIGELLEIWGSIINGFTLPLKEEHRQFLMRVLIPLHKPKGILTYYRQLAYCVTQFVHKEPSLGGVVAKGILRYWPIANWQKEVLIIGEMEELIEYIDPEEFVRFAIPICSQIARCMTSWNAQVAERALYVWNNGHFVRMTSVAMEKVLPAIVEALEKNLNWHWSKAIRQLTLDVKSVLEDMEPVLYSKCLQEINLRASATDQEEEKRKLMWERLEMAAANTQLASHSCSTPVSN